MVDPETFAIYMAGVRTLDERRSRIPATASRIERAARDPRPAPDPDADARARMRSLVIEGIRFEISGDGERAEGRRLDVDPRELRRLRQARYPIDRALDLGGLQREEARDAVEAFVRERRAGGDRVVAIVHGQGTDPPELAAWLSQGRAAREVAAFSVVQQAVLVLLAR